MCKEWRKKNLIEYISWCKKEFVYWNRVDRVVSKARFVKRACADQTTFAHDRLVSKKTPELDFHCVRKKWTYEMKKSEFCQKHAMEFWHEIVKVWAQRVVRATSFVSNGRAASARVASARETADRDVMHRAKRHFANDTNFTFFF